MMHQGQYPRGLVVFLLEVEMIIHYSKAALLMVFVVHQVEEKECDAAGKM